MKVILDRFKETRDGTFGRLILDGKVLCVTLEEPWLGNKSKISCIPAGTYTANKYSGTKFKDVWHVEEVPGRSFILIHAGNTIEDTEGCILVGTRHNSVGVVESKKALDYLRTVLSKSFTLEVTSLG